MKLLAAAFFGTILVVALLMGGAEASGPPYDGVANATLNYKITSWTVVRSSGPLYVRSLRTQIVGAQVRISDRAAKRPWPLEFFACWFAGPHGVQMIDDFEVIASPFPNANDQEQIVEFPASNYPKGLPSPEAGASILCGWQKAPYPLRYGFAHVQVIYSDGTP